MMNKKAQSLNINVIIIVILAVLVLLILVLSFTGGMKASIDKTLGFSVATSTEEAVEFCNLWCSQESYKTWCGYEFTKIEGASKEEPKYCRDIAGSCPSAGC